MVISFRDYARETLLVNGLISTKAGERLSHFLSGLGREPLAISDLKMSPQYKGLTERTVQRDIALLKTLELVRVEKELIYANLDVMTQFTAISELQKGTPVAGRPSGKRAQKRLSPIDVPNA